MRKIYLVITCLIFSVTVFAQDNDSAETIPQRKVERIEQQAGAPAAPAGVPVMLIAGIEVKGNKTTRPEILEMYFAFKVGYTLDLEALRETRTALLRTQLFRKVDIFPHVREDGAHIFIILDEAIRLQLSYGGKYYTRKHGRDDFWYCFNAGASLSNFRGRLEDLSFGGALWEKKSADIAWTKPFLTNPYYITVGSSFAHYPDEALPENYTDVTGQMTVGRSITQNMRLAVSGIPTYRHIEFLSGKQQAWHDSVKFPRYDRDLYEAFGALNLINDHRRAWFDPKRGWYMNTGLRTNLPHSGVNKTFFQLNNELRTYLPLLFDDHAIIRFALTLRDTDAGEYHRLTYGSMGTVRGYYEEALGWNFVTNSSILLSLKYHKPLWESQPMPVPVFNMIYRDLGERTYRLDATFIADYARLYADPLGAVTQDGATQYGIGLGGGIRILIPDIRQSGCIDWVYGRRETENGVRWRPMLHVYLDMFY